MHGGGRAVAVVAVAVVAGRDHGRVKEEGIALADVEGCLGAEVGGDPCDGGRVLQHSVLIADGEGGGGGGIERDVAEEAAVGALQDFLGLCGGLAVIIGDGLEDLQRLEVAGDTFDAYG